MVAGSLKLCGVARASWVVYARWLGARRLVERVLGKKSAMEFEHV